MYSVFLGVPVVLYVRIQGGGRVHCTVHGKGSGCFGYTEVGRPLPVKERDICVFF